MREISTAVKPRPRILVVDDNQLSQHLTRDMLQMRGYEVFTASDADEGRRALDQRSPDLVLLDVVMPGRSGIEFCREIKDDARTRLIPVILVTGQTEREARLRGIEAGADDFLNKPVDPQELFARVQSLLKLKQFTDELENAETVLFSLALGIEARDPYTEGHCQRLSYFASQLGKRLQLPEQDIVALRRAGVLHDIGKISVSDAILKKPEGLSAEEWDVMRQHPIIGEQICGPLRSLARVLPIIRHHHEHWNGHGYPDGLKREQIPLLARILQVVDAYDALTTARPYKPALNHQDAIRVLQNEAAQGKWDPDVLQAFVEMMEEREQEDQARQEHRSAS